MAGIVAAVVGVLLFSASARASDVPDPACVSAGLTDARVSTSVELLHDDRTFTKVVTKLTVDVPGDWVFAEALLLSGHSPGYTTAMACLTRQATGWQEPPRWWEWRPGLPEVTAEKDGRVHVVYEAHSWVSQFDKDLDVGIWRLRAGTNTWSLTLRPPPALGGAQWDKITVDPGAPGIESAQPWPAAEEDGSRLVWRPENRVSGARSAPAMVVVVRPSWQRSWAAQNERLTAQGLGWVGGLLWTAATSALLLWAVARYGRRHRRPDLVLDNLAHWAVVAVALFVLTYTDDLIRWYDESRRSEWWFEDALLRGHVFALAASALLLAFAKPPRRVWIAGGLLMLPPAVIMARPQTFHLRHDGRPMTSDLALAAETTASCCLLAVTVLGFLAVAWRLAADGKLIPKSRRPVARGAPPADRELRLRIVVPAVVAWTVAVALCYAFIEERNWQRASWLSDRGDPLYGYRHREDFLWEAMRSASDGQEWLLGYAWILTGIAMLAVLRTKHASKHSPLDDPADRLLFLAFFPIAVSVSGDHLANSLAEFLWTPVYMLALYAAVAPCREFAVLEQRFERSQWPLAAAAGTATRRKLMKDSRIYRETHAALRRLDQGLFGDEPPQRQSLEDELDNLHDWPAGGPLPFRDRLPAHVSVVDAALALGPRDSWWDNGVRGARCALIPSLLATLLSIWAGFVRGGAWRDTLLDLFGLPSMVLAILYWMATWVGGGFFLGALWRVLPGRRGAVKAIPVALAFAVPVALDALFGWFTREGAANLALHAATMLLVLTVTGIALDLDTFRGERRYWQSRLGLLLSIYQMRYYSLQVAYVIGQIIAVITIWQFFAEPAATPPAGGK
ncbi:DUF6185 family protein [Streptomyces justiciae]|uniref:DUF6185 family protein n=1 Tax=Streptomyces justiciae TaxID=2780140 RepID=UPI001880AF3D|nr:DUF6185 family protein [Streptomyces justiciae]MBE8475496.1 hypothetical protein [Streptomyces justiciae]